MRRIGHRPMSYLVVSDDRFREYYHDTLEAAENRAADKSEEIDWYLGDDYDGFAVYHMYEVWEGETDTLISTWKNGERV